MQRRVAAIYFAFFLVMAMSAYSVIAVAEEPAIDVAGEPLAQGDTITVSGAEYTVTNISEVEEEGTTTMVGQLATTNDSAVYSAELANGSALSPTNSSWPGKAATSSATVADGDPIQFNGSQQTANISDGNFALIDAAGNETTTFSVGDTLEYEGDVATVTEIGSDSATLVWGENYEVVIANASDPDEFRAVQSFNVTQRLQEDPDVENQTFEGDDGRFVRYRNGTTQPLDEYLPEPDETTFTEGGTLTYRATDDLSVPANETTIANVSSDRVLLEWTGSRTTTQELTEGANVTLAGQQRVVHFTEDETVILTPEFDAYQNEVAQQDYYQERMNGLWGISILSGLAGIFVIGLAYLPTRG
jgi:sorbitol-specific phosphotransferase system component IIA